MDAGLRMRKHAKKQGNGIPTTVRTTSVDVTDTSAQSSPSLTLSRPEPTTSSTSTTIRDRPTPTTSSTEEDDEPSTTSTPPSSSTTTTEEEEETTTTSTTSSTSESSTELTTTTIISTSTSSRLPATTTSLDTTSSSSTLTTPSSRSLVTSFVTASASLSTALSTTARSTLAGSNNENDTSDGPSAGTVVGIVAGALVGVVVLSGIVGYFFRTKCSNKNDDDYDGENPFGTIDNAYGANQSRGEMRRDSQLLADDDSVHQMSELGHNSHNNGAGYGMGMGMAGAAAVGGAAAGYGLNRANTTMTNAPPGLQRADTVTPRPPTMIQRHYANMAAHTNNPMPNAGQSFQPGQIVNPGQYYPSSQINQSGPYPSFPPGMAAAGAGAAAAGYGHSRGFSNENNNGYPTGQDLPMRSGTPEYNNPQQYFHQAHDSYSSMANASGAAQGQMGVNPFDSSNALSGNGGQGNSSARQPGMDSQTRARRTLSVRNGGLDDAEGVRDSVYGGM